MSMIYTARILRGEGGRMDVGELFECTDCGLFACDICGLFAGFLASSAARAAATLVSRRFGFPNLR